MGRSIWAVVAGILFTVVATTAIDVLLHLTGVFPPQGQPLTDALAVLATAYRIPISVAGAYLTARLAPSAPMTHALVLGGIGTALGALGAAITWDLGLGPRWYAVLLAVLALPQCWAGGRLWLARHPTTA